jgi:hypothetical protein
MWEKEKIERHREGILIQVGGGKDSNRGKREN